MHKHAIYIIIHVPDNILSLHVLWHVYMLICNLTNILMFVERQHTTKRIYLFARCLVSANIVLLFRIHKYDDVIYKLYT